MVKERGAKPDFVPPLDDGIRIQVAMRYIQLYERVTGLEFDLPSDETPILESIEESIAPYFE